MSLNIGRNGRMSHTSPLTRNLASGVSLRVIARRRAALRRRQRARGAGGARAGTRRTEP
ncbi:hypothetical protein SBA4_2020011 [Candidatus Sulfopaludibacter sp. SbA4]|nr:hypothetical protein SBA4_2020011 [Candidatus Sulfopaludibacter sp. SbA4]